MNPNAYVLVTKANHLVGGHQLWSGLGRDGLRQAIFAQDTPHEDDSHFYIHAGSAVARDNKGRSRAEVIRVLLVEQATRYVPGAASSLARGTSEH